MTSAATSTLTFHNESTREGHGPEDSLLVGPPALGQSHVVLHGLSRRGVAEDLRVHAVMDLDVVHDCRLFLLVAVGHDVSRAR